MNIQQRPLRLQDFRTTVSMESAKMNTERIQNNEPIQKESKKVRFSHSLQIHETLHVSNFTEEELDNTWYNICDVSRLRREEQQTLELLNSGNYRGDCDQHCARGLEKRVRKGALDRRHNREVARLTVLDEQDRQEYQLQDNPEAIAKAYIAACNYSMVVAYNVAVLDALYASDKALPTHNGEKRSRKKRVGPLSRIFRRKRNTQ